MIVLIDFNKKVATIFLNIFIILNMSLILNDVDVVLNLNYYNVYKIRCVNNLQFSCKKRKFKVHIQI